MRNVINSKSLKKRTPPSRFALCLVSLVGCHHVRSHLFDWFGVTCQVLLVRCHLLGVTCRVSLVGWHLSCGTCRVALVGWHLSGGTCRVALVGWHLSGGTCQVALVRWHSLSAHCTNCAHHAECCVEKARLEIAHFFIRKGTSVLYMSTVCRQRPLSECNTLYPSAVSCLWPCPRARCLCA